MKPLPTPSRGGDPVNPHVVEATAEPKPDFEAMRKECFTFPEHLEDALQMVPAKYHAAVYRCTEDAPSIGGMFYFGAKLIEGNQTRFQSGFHPTWQAAFAELWGML